ncbi:MAG TPA: beta-ketoacyl synthase N-terminal-like domain-containing protein [Puia sp.]|nr:beta-ketoacyl synthase N-terminal-like domain-containing protein [Puia sp.]
MDIFIRSASSISPQKTFGTSSFLSEVVVHRGNRMNCIEPDYKEFIDPKLTRRMSRIIRMGVAASSQCLKDAALQNPDAIITGTAYGCLEDTGIFLTKMVEQKEELLTPTAFIQSTHNTVAAQIALMLHCHNYNNTFVHRGFSFESALLDAIMLLNEGEAKNVLAGGVDEITKISHTILSRFGLYKQEENFPAENLFLGKTKGTVAGEGATFFVLSDQNNPNNLAKLRALKTFYKPANNHETENEIISFLKEQAINPGDIDLLITGRNGDPGNDKIYEELSNSLFQHTNSIHFKQLCGEYPTAVAFALWLAAHIIKENKLPAALTPEKTTEHFKKILIYNHYQNIHHSILFISAC